MAGVVDFRKPLDKSLPSDRGAEQALLGALMYDNGVLDRIADLVSPADFAEPIHGRIFECTVGLINSGRLGDPIIVADLLRGETALEELGGARYLGDLIDTAPPAANAAEYAKLIREIHIRRELIQLGQAMIATAEGGETSEFIIENTEKDLLGLQMHAMPISLVGAAEAIDRVEFQINNPASAFGVRLGLGPIDEVTGGFMPGELWLGAGRPSMGKSAVVSSAALHVARRGMGAGGEGLGVIEICSEMTVEQMMRRHLSDACYDVHGANAPTYFDMRNRSMTAAQTLMVRDAAAELRGLGTLKSLYRTGLTVPTIRGLVRRQKSAWMRQGIKLAMVTIDHGGLIREASQVRGRSEAQGQVARDMKELAGELDVALFVIVQLNRNVETRDDKRPQLSDLRDSGEWEENADGAIGFYRPAYYAQRQPEPKRADAKLLWDEERSSRTVEAILMKVREGKAQTVKLWADIGRNAIRGEAPESTYAPSTVYDEPGLFD